MSCYKPIITNGFNKNVPISMKKITTLKQYQYLINYDWKNQAMLPCRKCIGCKTDHAKEWALRAKLENKNSPNNFFITLTYKDEYIPKNQNEKNTLKQKDLITFINTLRKHFHRKSHNGIKYIASSEYGTKTKRPHYHICFFNLPITDTEFLKKKKGNNYYISKTIDKMWNKGMHVIGKTTYESVGYTARYTLKKLDKIDYKKNDIEPEKLTMSKGIGLKFFEENWETIYKYDYIPTEDRNFKPPKYYDRKLKEINPELLEEIKKHRKEIFTQNIENEINSQQTLLTEIMGNKQRRLHKNLKKISQPLRNEN